MRSFKSSSEVLSATSGLGLAGTRRRGGAGGGGAWWGPGPRGADPAGTYRAILHLTFGTSGRAGLPRTRARCRAAGARRGRIGARLGRGRWGGSWSGRGLALFLFARLDRRGTLLEPEAVGLADHG